MAPNIRATAFSNGDALPESKPDKWRLYSMRFCPFAHRTRLALAHKNVDHETVNINLKDKPEWYFTINPLGAVPAIEKGDTIIYDSAICNDYLDDIIPERPLYPKDPYEKAKLKVLIQRFGKAMPLLFGLKRLAGDEAKLKEALADLTQALKPFEDALQGKFFGGDDLSMLDVHMWPLFERAKTFMPNGDVLKSSPKLAAWRTNMLAHPTVKATMFSDKLHKDFSEGNAPAGVLLCDIGL